ncbi:MAG: hypothetical protein ABA06_04620 [Parcubacteria bacterium C7867-001]|nr:MAG: hypothetical protein ABA06_04620 [Parcubacteria bacterium C7867-001]
MPALEELRQRVAAGAAFLDAHDPQWRMRVTKKVKVASTHECVLAQLYGRYRAGMEKYGLSEDDSLNYGFRVDSREVGYEHEASRQYYFQLNECWGAELKRR